MIFIIFRIKNVKAYLILNKIFLYI
jgi:hypothetical protein